MHISGEQTKAEKTIVQVGHLLSTGEQPLSTETPLQSVSSDKFVMVQKASKYQIKSFLFYQALSEIV